MSLIEQRPNHSGVCAVHWLGSPEVDDHALGVFGLGTGTHAEPIVGGLCRASGVSVSWCTTTAAGSSAHVGHLVLGKKVGGRTEVMGGSKEIQKM